MKSSSIAVGAFLVQAVSTPFVGAFTPSSFLNNDRAAAFVGTSHVVTAANGRISRVAFNLSMSSSSGGKYIGMDDEDDDYDDEDEDEDDDDYLDDDDEYLSTSKYGGGNSPFAGLKLDPYDPNPLIKPRPSVYFPEEQMQEIPDDQIVQEMSQDERKENLEVMRQIFKSDLPDLRLRRDYAGWVEANNELQRRTKRDPWYDLNDRIYDAYQLGEEEKLEKLVALAKKVGGPPPGVETGGKVYALETEVFDMEISANQAEVMLERELEEERFARAKAMRAEMKRNLEKQQEQFEEDIRNPGVREEREAKERREATMRRLMSEIEEDNKKRREQAKELLGKLPEPPESRTKSLENALQEARDDIKKLRRVQMGLPAESKSGTKTTRKSSAAKAREAAEAESSGGRPRLPGDKDVTRGEVDITVEDSSTTVTGPLKVEVSSVYNKDQSDPPMRKHCFQYTIRITNNSSSDTIQLLGRRFEIQTVGSSMKDVVQGEGVTGRTPVLKPGEVFEYTSTAPLSVRPLGTTIIAARMSGEYKYVVLEEGQDTATEEQIKSDSAPTAELGMFHFIFPEDQRVKPFRSEDGDEDDDDLGDDEDDEDDEDLADDDDDDDDDYTPAKKASSSTPASRPASTPSAAPASTLPGDEDMQTGNISVPLNDNSEKVTENVKVAVTSSYRPERSDAGLDKHCFAYNIRITNQSEQPIQLVSRRFEIQTVGSANKDVVQGPGVTGRQPVLKPGESFEYTSTAPLNVKPMSDKTPVVARMQGEYNFVVLGDDGSTPLSSTPLQAELGMFHFILPALSAS